MLFNPQVTPHYLLCPPWRVELWTFDPLPSPEKFTPLYVLVLTYEMATHYSNAEGASAETEELGLQFMDAEAAEYIGDPGYSLSHLCNTSSRHELYDLLAFQTAHQLSQFRRAQQAHAMLCEYTGAQQVDSTYQPPPVFGPRADSWREPND